MPELEGLTEKQKEAARRLRDYLRDLDARTREPDEEPLLKTVARQAREAREEMEGSGG